MVNAIKGSKKSQDQVLQSFLPRTSLRSDCRPGLALLAQLASQAVVGFTLEEVKGRAFRSYEVSLVHHACQVSLGFNGIATELGLECDCSDSHWFLSPKDFLQFRAEWVPYLDRFSAAVHNSELPHFERTRQLSHRQKLLLGNQCPKEADLEPKVPKALPRLLCVVPALWPRDLKDITEMALTSLADCDLCIFFVSSKDAPQQIRGCQVVDLSTEAEVGLDPADKHTVVVDNAMGRSEPRFNSNSNLLAKVSHMMLHVAEVQQPQHRFDWTCLVETDVYFVAANFRRLVSLLQLSPKDSHWLGHEVLANHLYNGIQIEPNSGSCLSAFALQQLGQFFSWFVLRHRRQLPIHEHPYYFQWERPPLSGECRPFDPNTGQSFYQTALSACFRAAGVYPTDPRNLVDLRGRLYYPNVPVEKLPDMLRPPERPNCCWGEAPNLDGDDNDFVFAGLNYLFLRCRGKQKIWAADYPIVFHPHLCTNCSAMIGFKKTTLRQKAVYQLLTNPHYTCKTCKGYRPGYDRRFAKKKSARP